MMLEHVRRMARYNCWANGRLFAAVAALPEGEYEKPRPAFFVSIHGTLNHILVGDLVWLARIEGVPKPALKLDDHPHPDLSSLTAARTQVDGRIIRLVDATDERALAGDVHYTMVTRPGPVSTPLHLCWLHLFNHQTHHRGQVHDQLSQTAVAPPPLDLIYYLREAA